MRKSLDYHLTRRENYSFIKYWKKLQITWFQSYLTTPILLNPLYYTQICIYREKEREREIQENLWLMKNNLNTVGLNENT